MNRMDCRLGQLGDRVNTAIDDATRIELAKRIWRKDATLWKDDEANQKIIKNSLGWLTVPDEMIGVVDELIEFADLIRSRGFKTIMVCGMGGSSLCPEVLARTFGPQPGFPELLVLDSTDPDVLDDLMKRVELEHCLFVVASKSGSTTEPNAFYKFWYEELSKRVSNPGENFIAITDPGSPLVQTAEELSFQRTFLNQADIGGRYSALSYFGLVPASLMGIDIRRFLQLAKAAEQLCSPSIPANKNAALQLGIMMGECALAGRDKLTLVIDDRVATLGLWIEQLVAESTGKEGKGILPVASEPIGPPTVYSDDRLFVSISIGSPSEKTKAQLANLADAGHPVISRELDDIYDLGGEFFVWEFATACAGWRLGINPFDQPNVQEAKDATKDLLATFVSQGKLPEEEALSADEEFTLYGAEKLRRPNNSIEDVLRAHLAGITKGDYIGLLAYFEETAEIDQALQSIRLILRERTKCATTVGYGPRFLHSTGQLHKGGPDTGVFFQFTANDKVDFAVPGESYTFSILKQAQAVGDFRALTARGRRAIRVELGDHTLNGLTRLKELIGRIFSETGAATTRS